VIGPGLGGGNRALVERLLAHDRASVVIDADALSAFAGDVSGLRVVLNGRTAVLTPHPGECGRLLGIETTDVLENRFDIGLRLARETNAIVVLKGTPNVISAPDGRVVVAPVGSPVLATGGSGDVLAGVLGALLATMPNAYDAALAAVWAHGAAAESVATSYVRGSTLEDVVHALRDVWRAEPPHLPRGVLATFPAVGER
jgi:NAD(P)H-hydrate epimerase